MTETKPIEIPASTPITLPLNVVDAALNVLAQLPAGQVATLLIAMKAQRDQQVNAIVTAQAKPTAVKLPDTPAVRKKRRS